MSGKSWIDEHVSDPHVRRATVDGYRSRAVYKLEELDRRDRLLRSGMTVLELGAAPGGWTQYVTGRVGDRGRVIATDILPMDPVAGAEFVQGDFTEQAVADEIAALMGDRGADLVLSDMAPNLTGVAGIDQARSTALAELALEMASEVLKPGGALAMKVFQGEGFDALVKAVRRIFRVVKIRKPEASRSRSREVYLVATELL